MKKAGRVGWVGLLSAVLAAVACQGGTEVTGVDGGLEAGTGGIPDAAVESGAVLPVLPVVISTATRTPRVTTLSVNYWMWPAAFGDPIAGTEAQVAPLLPAVMRIGGYNNDANTPDPFDDGELDKAVAYARAIGAQPLLQVPHLADTAGQPPTAAEAADLVRYANVTMGYGIKYFSVGNEPDLYSTSGLPSDSTQPAIPGYMPSDYCASAATYVAAMKAVDPTIQIVGPDLAYRYVTGSGANDWLTPILETCGDLFDVVSIHRYPFEAAQATLPAAAADATAFRALLVSVRGLMQSAGYPDKPLALTEMNVVYDATTCVLAASPRTVGSALWMADGLGVGIESGLWTSAVWAISDDNTAALGIIGLPPAHLPRPEYYAYQLYADHFGPTVLDVTSMPVGVSAHASRNQADDATEVIVINWNGVPTALAFQVTGLPTAPDTATFVLPPVSMASVEIPDNAPASALVYSDAQVQTPTGLQSLAPGAVPPDAGGVSGGDAGVLVGTGCGDAAVACTDMVLPTASITTMGTASGTTLTYGTSSDAWISYTYAATGQTAPTATVTPDGNGIQIAGGFVAPVDVNANYMGVGLYFSSSGCADASAYTGVKFDFSGDLGGCSLAFGAASSEDLSHAAAARGTCSGASSATCYGPSATVAPATTTSATTVMVPFATLSGGMPVGTLDPTSVVSVQWQLGGPVGADGGGCMANFTVENVAFY
jgi:hypothetical protein